MKKLLRSIVKYLYELVIEIHSDYVTEITNYLTQKHIEEKDRLKRYYEIRIDSLNTLLQIERNEYLATYRYLAKEIPNTKENLQLIELLRKHLNAELKIRVRGRGSRKEFGNQSDIDLQHAQTLAIYVNKKKC